MSLSIFIAKRLARGKFKSFASFIIKLAWLGVGLSVAVMIIAVAIVIGYKKQISEKVVGFGGHIEVQNLGTAHTLDHSLFTDSLPIKNKIINTPNIANTTSIITKPAIIKTNDEIEGILFKGVDKNYDFSFFQKNLVKGRIPNTKDSFAKREIIISQLLANKFKIDTGATVRVYFVQEPIRVIPCKITGIYETGLEENDLLYVIGSLREMQRIFAKNKNSITHYEITIKDLKQLDKTTTLINNVIPPELNAENMVYKNPQIFDWLGYLDQNITIILGLMIIVSCINMITALLILIIERTNMIGILKALGASYRTIRNIFLNHIFYILCIGLLFGNIIGIGLCLLQKYFKIIRLSQETYYLSYVPIELNVTYILIINIGTIILCMFTLLITARVLKHTHPVKAIKFN